MGITINDSQLVNPFCFFFLNFWNVLCIFLISITIHLETIFKTTLGDNQKSLCESILLKSILFFFFTTKKFSFY